MSDENDSDRIVEVVRKRPAYTHPSFIVEQDGRYYVTVAVLEYDPKARGITKEQREGVAEIERLYRGGERGRFGIVEVSRGIGIGLNTGPSHSD